MKARYFQRGESIDYTPDTDVAAGDVIRLGKLTGVAKLDIKAGELGAVALTGVYEIGKDSAVAFDAGELVAYNPATGQVCKAGTSGAHGFGHAIAAFGTGTLTAHVRLAQGID